VDRTAEFRIPHDVQYGDIDIMEKSLDFTIGKPFSGLPEYVKALKARGIKFMTILVRKCLTYSKNRKIPTR